MKICITADLHYGMYKTPELIRKMAVKVMDINPDVFAIAGDISQSGDQYFAECLMQFKQFNGKKICVAGNHDIWTKTGNSKMLYESTLPQLAAISGFHYLDQKYLIYNDVAFVGNMAWYDYSFREPGQFPATWYLHKEWPEKAIYYDRDYVHLGISDDEFTQILLMRLKQQLEYLQQSKDVKKIICIFHHIPVKQLLRSRKDKISRFLNAFAGSTLFGELIKRYAKVKYVYCGHTHKAKKFNDGQIKWINIGSDYLKPEMITLSI